MSYVRYNILVLLSLVAASIRAGIIPTEETADVANTEAVAGGVAKLSCNITPPITGDTVYLVIWYKEGLKSPIYSYDSRDKTSSEAAHWSDEKTVGGRISFELGVGRYPARLTLQAVRDSDAGIYRCRVDFKKSPTRYYNVNLTVILPPDSLSVINEKGDHIPNYILGPYVEGSSVNITCISSGGRPSPRVTWWQENALLDETYERINARQVRNVLRLENLERRHLNAVYTCQASNNNLVAPISSAVTLDMILRPLSVKLLGENRPLSADSKYEITCQVVGARPPPIVSWWKGNLVLRSAKKSVSEDGNTTISVLSFTPSVEDFGKILTCRADTQYATSSSVTDPFGAGKPFEDSWKLNVYYVPIVNLSFGSKLNSSVLKEGVDVYFECSIKSNPWIYRVSWKHNGRLIFNNPNAGILVSNQSLVLQKVSRSQAGAYQCIGSNQEGDGESNPLYLDIKFIPVCRPGQETTYGAGRGEITMIPCEIEANPTDLKFIWKFNTSAGSIDLLEEHFTTESTKSVAKFTPMTELDYGSLSCWAQNELGIQQEPCVYHVIPAGRPDPVYNCTVLNRTFDALSINCESGFDGGLNQEFAIEVYDIGLARIVGNSTSSEPAFLVTGLTSGLEYELRLYAFNQKGRSEVQYLKTFTLKSPQKHVGTLPPELDVEYVIALGCGLVTFVLLSVCVVAMIKLKGGGKCKKKKKKTEKKKTIKEEEFKQRKSNSSSVDSIEKDPDIIPSHNEDYADEDEKAFQRLNRRYYAQQQHSDNHTLPLEAESVTYAELSLPHPAVPYSSNTADCTSSSSSSSNSCNSGSRHCVNSNTVVGCCTAQLPQIFEEPTIYAHVETTARLDQSEVAQDTPLLSSSTHHKESMV